MLSNIFNIVDVATVPGLGALGKLAVRGLAGKTVAETVTETVAHGAGKTTVTGTGKTVEQIKQLIADAMNHCHRCGRPDHMANECAAAADADASSHNNNNNNHNNNRYINKSSSSIVCYQCGAVGHFARDSSLLDESKVDT